MLKSRIICTSLAAHVSPPVHLQESPRLCFFPAGSCSDRPWPLQSLLFPNPDVSTGVTRGQVQLSHTHSNNIQYHTATKKKRSFFTPTLARTPCKPQVHTHSGGAESFRLVWGQLNFSPIQSVETPDHWGFTLVLLHTASEWVTSISQCLWSQTGTVAFDDSPFQDNRCVCRNAANLLKAHDSLLSRCAMVEMALNLSS